MSDTPFAVLIFVNSSKTSEKVLFSVRFIVIFVLHFRPRPFVKNCNSGKRSDKFTLTINAEHCISSLRKRVYSLRLMIYTWRWWYTPDGDDMHLTVVICTLRVMIYNMAEPCWWYAIAFATDKKIPSPETWNFLCLQLKLATS